MYSGKELAKEIEGLCKPLREGAEGDWALRMKAMKRLQGLILGPPIQAPP